MTTTITPELHAHVAKLALQVDQVAEALERGILDPESAGDAICSLIRAASRVLDAFPTHPNQGELF